MFELSAHIRAAKGKCRDRAAWTRQGNRLVIAVADGSGNNPDSGFAAEFAIRTALKFVGHEPEPLDPEQWRKIVAEIDEPLSLQPSGETTLVVADFGSKRLTGASIGDSVAWLIDGGKLTELTAQQKRKPLLGSGEGVVTAFEGGGSGILLVASDGLAKYAARDKVAAGVPNMNAGALIDLARLPDGSLFDDASVVLTRHGTGALPAGSLNWVDFDA